VVPLLDDPTVEPIVTIRGNYLFPNGLRCHVLARLFCYNMSIVKRKLVHISMADDLPSEWGRPKLVSKMFGVSISTLYELIADGKIDSFLLREHDAAKMGARLINLASVRKFFVAQAAKQKQPESLKN